MNHEFDLLYKGSYNHEISSYVEENVTVEEIVHDNQDVECLPTIVSDYYGFEDLFSLDTNHEDQFSFSQRALEISEGNPQQLSYLQINEIGSSHETRNMQRQSKLQLEQHEEIAILDPMVVDLEDFINLSYAPFSSEQKDRKYLM
jgi:hypothetical protein